MAGASEFSPPCRAACPLDKDVPAFLRAIAARDTGRAWQIALRDNLFPGVLGWICPRPCESVCRRSRLASPVPICRLKRWVGGREGNGKHVVPRFEPTGPSIAVIGAGPAGLAAAHDLTVLGARVSVFDSRDEAGGLLTSCIPGFRLPEEVVREDVRRILSMGMRFHPGTRFGSLDEARGLLSQGFVALLLALGGGHDKVPAIPGWRGGAGITTAIDFLADYRKGTWSRPLGRTVVIGGGNAALDVARTAVREGGAPVEILYRRDWGDMRVPWSEIEEARAERVRFRILTVVSEVVWEGDGLAGVRVVSGEDESFLPVDTLISAIGQSQPFGGPSARGSDGATEIPGVFACGDYVTGPTTVADAIASGRRAAARLRAALGSDGTWPCPDHALTRLREGYLPATSASLRADDFAGDPVWEAAVADARDCLHCDQLLGLHPDRCVLCGACSSRCPEDSLRWIQNSRTGGFTLTVDDSTCTRCGDCVAGCPVGAIHWSLWTSPNRNLEHREILTV